MNPTAYEIWIWKVSNFTGCSCEGPGFSGKCDHESCLCKLNVKGPKCTKCVDGFHGYPDCTLPCDVCFVGGTKSINHLSICSSDADNKTPQCECLDNFMGHLCHQCQDGTDCGGNVSHI